MTHKEFIKRQEEEYQKLRNSGNIETSTSEYFGQIGSVPIEDIKYRDQVIIKQEILNELFQDLLEEKLLLEQSPKNKEYRFRMDYVCTNNPKFEPHNRMGQRKRKNFNWVIDMETCPLMDSLWFRKVRNVYKKALQLDIPMYDVVSAKGNLRYLIIRADKEKGMLSIVSKEMSNEINQLMDFAVSEGFTSVYSIIQPEKGDHVDGEINSFLGEKYLEVNVSGKSILVGPHSFFQNNIPAFEKIIDYIKSYLGSIPELEKYTFVDLYCGVGTIGICLGGIFTKISYGIEIVEASIEIAKQNAINNNQNIEFISSKVRQGILPAELLNKELITVVDPPRAGLEKFGIEAIAELKSKYLIYVSCNPVSQARDLSELLNLGYKVIEGKGFDLYPNTYHLENVLILEISK